METRTAHSRGGWQEDEIDMLFGAVKEAEEEGRPLRDAFMQVGNALSRKPNSIRNFYYARVREMPGNLMRKAPFRTFTQEELSELLRTVLMARGQGESVRACVTRMADGDRSLMLRYQNKYRSILKGRPDLLEAAARSLREDGLPCPAQIAPKRRGGFKVPGAIDSADGFALSERLGDHTVEIVLGQICGLLRKLETAQEEAENLRAELENTAEKRMRVTVSDLRGDDSDFGDGAVSYEKWADAKRESDRLRVQLDLLKMHLEDMFNKQQDDCGELRELLEKSRQSAGNERNALLEKALEKVDAMLG